MSPSLFFLGVILLITGCAPPADGPAQSNTTVTNTAATNTNTAPVMSEAEAANVPITLPVLDALLTDEAFAEKAKSELGLTDEELAKVREAARDAVLQLGQQEISDDDRSTRSALEAAKTKVREALGAEKGNRLIALAQREWAGQGGEMLANAKPNAVPTDTRVVVNAPAYRMDVFENGHLKKSYKVGIGYPEFPLPVGLRKAETIIFNPTWTPPDEPWVEGKVQPGKTVEAGSKLNPLGPIKIPIGLPSLVHGGKAESRLGTFASHGCVGLTDRQIQDFALQLSSLGQQPLTLDQIKGFEKDSKKTTDHELATPIPVELRYETIVVEDGKLKIYRDVYERGTNTEENLRKVLETYGVTLDSLADREKILDGLESMAVDALGKPVEANGNTNTNTSNANKKNQSDKVTRNIKGKKEVVFELAELKGKGYPAPLMDS